MFDKHKTSKPEAEKKPFSQDTGASATASPGASGPCAVIGRGINIKGDIAGDENLRIEGKVVGKIRLAAHQVEVGKDGKVNADITAKVIRIAGEVRGDVTGTEKVVISSTGNVHGNIVAPRMTLEDGALFKGSIDMDPGEPAKAKPVEAASKPAEKPADKEKAVAAGTVKSGSGYSLNGR